MIDQDTAERAAYQRAVELAKDEIARLRAERDQAEQDNAGMLTILREIDLTCSRPDHVESLLAQVRESAHPGRAIMGKALAELDAARAVIAWVRWAVGNNYAPPPLCDALDAYDKATKARKS